MPGVSLVIIKEKMQEIAGATGATRCEKEEELSLLCISAFYYYANTPGKFHHATLLVSSCGSYVIYCSNNKLPDFFFKKVPSGCCSTITIYTPTPFACALSKRRLFII